MKQVYEEYAERVLDILEAKDPDEVSNVKALMEKYEGREQQLYEQLCVKYNVDSLPASAAFVSRGRKKRNIKVFCRFRPPNDIERAHELESMYKESFNMGSRDYQTFRAALDNVLTSRAPVKVELDRKGNSFRKPFDKFETEDVVLWLRSLGLSKYEQLFKVKKVDGCWLRSPPPFSKKPALKLTDEEVVNFHRKNKSTKFKLDGVLRKGGSQEEMFEMIGWDQVASVLGGYNSTVLAYGQTGSGKTHTMLGPEGGIVGLDSSKDVGIVPRCIEIIISRLQSSEQVKEYDLNMAIMEIDAEKMKDLLTPGLKLQLRYVGKDSTVTNLSWWKLESHEETLRLIKLAVSRRQASAHALNEGSSRSHLIISLKLTSTLQDGNVQMSRLNFGDLAGSERDTRGKGKSKDKKSIFALQNVIRALAEERAFVPYHGGMLTKLLRDSLGGNSRTSIIIHGSIHECNRSDTVSALQFGELARKVFSEPKPNVILSRKEMETQLSSMQEELNYLRRLKAQKNKLHSKRSGSSRKMRRRSRSQRKSISGQIRDSFVLLLDPADRPEERTSLQWIDSVIKDNEIVDYSEDEAEIPTILEKPTRKDRKREQEDAREIEMLQEKLTAINVRFKELQIESMKKDNQILGLEKTLQERSNEVSTLNTETSTLSIYPEELANERAKSAELQEQVRRLEKEALRMRNRINRRRNKKSKKKQCRSFFVFLG